MIITIHIPTVNDLSESLPNCLDSACDAKLILVAIHICFTLFSFAIPLLFLIVAMSHDFNVVSTYK
jgi:hypothetical protein